MSFWNDAWVQGLRPRDFAPLIFSASRRKNKTLSEALVNNTWIRDLNLLTAESGLHLLVECRLTKRIWEEVAAWAAVESLNPTTIQDCNKKGQRSLLILVNWTVWCERNARIFYHKFSTCAQILTSIRSEALVWICAAAKQLANLLASL
ncbi:hypothetical protein BS78_02G155400 [Paspalum vaginatum]|nr:hypothetical protein BS78_02G155400 [Paspalum vaginatum]